MTDEDRELLRKPRHERTQADVMRLRDQFGVMGGCCDRHADMQACDCLERAVDVTGRAPAERSAPIDLGGLLDDADLAVIKAQNDKLFALYNAAATKGLRRHTDYPEVAALNRHLDTHFPGNAVHRLLAEVARLRGRVAALEQDLEWWDGYAGDLNRGAG